MLNERPFRDRLFLAVKRVLYPNVVHPFQLRRLSFGDWVTQIAIAAGFLGPVIAVGTLTIAERARIGLLALAGYILANVLKARKQLNPTFQRKAQENYDERKVRFARIIARTGSWNDEKDPHDYQRECLDLIANYVRSYRWDVYSRVIFANLLVVDPEDDSQLKVIARDREGLFGSRTVPQTYERLERKVNSCFETGKTCIVDDLELEYGPEYAEKPYRSVLGIPLWSMDRKCVVGVLSIDSSESCHFRQIATELEWNLQPYIVALELSLARGVTDYEP